MALEQNLNLTCRIRSNSNSNFKRPYLGNETTNLISAGAKILLSSRAFTYSNIRYRPCLERDKETLNQKKMVFDNPWDPPTSQRHPGTGVTWIYKLGMRWYNLYHKSESGNEKWKWGNNDNDWLWTNLNQLISFFNVNDVMTNCKGKKGEKKWK